MATTGAPTFRDATGDDALAIATLLNAVADVLTARHGIGGWSTHVRPSTRTEDTRRVRVRLGVIDGEVVSVVRLQSKKPWAIDLAYFTPVEKAVYITGVAVSPEHQGQGLGRLAMEDARMVAFAWPARAIRLDSYASAAGAGGFYARCGYAGRGSAVYRGTPLAYHELLLG